MTALPEKPALIVSVPPPSLESEADTVCFDYISQCQNIKQGSPGSCLSHSADFALLFASSPMESKGITKQELCHRATSSVRTEMAEMQPPGIPALSSHGEPELSVLNARMITLAISSLARHGFRSRGFVFFSLPGTRLPLQAKAET